MRTSSSLRSQSLARRAAPAALASLFAVGTLTAHAPNAYADDTVSPHGKGIVGTALLGAEVVTITESFAGAHQGWAYILGGSLGAVAGGVGGYFIEHNDSSDGRVPAYLLAAGVGLVIPALVLSLNATRYMPSDTATEDKAPTNGPLANPGTAGGSAVGAPAAAPPSPASAPAPAGPPASPPAAAPTTTPPHAPLSLLDVQNGLMRLGVPVPEVRPVFSMAEVRQLGVQQQTEVRMPLVKVTFLVTPSWGLGPKTTTEVDLAPRVRSPRAPSQ